MKRSWILTCSLALIATASFALPPSDASVTLAAIFAPATPNQSIDTGEEKVFAAYTAKSTCIASCGSYNVSCSYEPPSTCVAVDRNCSSGQQGYVSCNGVTTYCSSCTAGCTEGTIRTETGPTCGCEDGMSTPKDRYKCIGGEWVYQFSFCGAPFCMGY